SRTGSTRSGISLSGKSAARRRARKTSGTQGERGPQDTGGVTPRPRERVDVTSIAHSGVRGGRRRSSGRSADPRLECTLIECRNTRRPKHLPPYVSGELDMERRLAGLGSLLGFLAVATGAFGAHALRGRLTPDLLEVWETASRYQMYHALAMLAAAWA